MTARAKTTIWRPAVSSLLAVMLVSALIAAPGFAQETSQAEEAKSQAAESEAKPATDSQQEDAAEGSEEATAEQIDPLVELAQEMSKNMKAIEDLLNQDQTGGQTQGLQDKAMDQIDKLIEEIQKRGM